MLAVVLLMSVSTWYLLQGLIVFEKPGPDVGFAAEEKQIPPGTQLTHVTGEDLDRSNIEIRGGVLLTDTGSTWSSGENVTVYPFQDEIMIIWNDGTDSAVLYEQKALMPPILYTIDKSDSVNVDGGRVLKGGVRSTGGDVDISENTVVYSRVNASNNVDLYGNNTVYRGAVTQNGDISVGQDGTLYGRVSAGGDVDTNDNVTVKGLVTARNDSGEDPNLEIGQNNEITGYVRGGGTNSDVDIGQDTVVNGNVSSSGQLDINENVVITSGIEAGGDLSVGQDSEISEGIEATSNDGNVDINSNTIVNGDIDANGSVDLDSGVTVTDGVEAGGDLSVGQDSQISGGIKMTDDGKVDINENAVVSGDIESNGNAEIGQDTYVNGDINADGDVTLKENVTVTGAVTADSLSCESGVTINGEPCNA